MARAAVWFENIEWYTASWNISRQTLAGFLWRRHGVRTWRRNIRTFLRVVVKPAVLVTPYDIKNAGLLLFHALRSFRAPIRPRLAIPYIVTAVSRRRHSASGIKPRNCEGMEERRRKMGGQTARNDSLWNVNLSASVPGGLRIIFYDCIHMHKN